MLRILLLSLLFVGLYRFLVRFVLPVFRITSSVRKQMRDMQRQQSGQSQSAPRRSAKKGDYIEFEEVR